MPQLDPSVFAPQLFWLAITFVILLVLMWRVALPKVGEVVILREERIEGNLKKAGQIKAEAEAALANYEKAVADARVTAQAEMQRAADEVAAESAKREAVFGQRLGENVSSAEGRIKAAKVEALNSVKSIAGELAQAITTKLSGTAPSLAATAGAVESAIKERA